MQPNPNITCKPGWCLEYVQNAFKAPVIEPTAISAWEHAQFKHYDLPPMGIAVPIWFSLAYEPAGHVALWMPDGSVYSTSSPTSTKPTHHSSLQALIDYYASANPLTYLGWSEDIETLRVVEEEMLTTANEIYYLRLGIYAEDKKVSDDDPDVGKDYFTVAQSYLDYANKNGFAYWQYKANSERVVVELNKQIADLEAKLIIAPRAEVPLSADTELAKDTNTKITWLQTLLSKIFK